MCKTLDRNVLIFMPNTLEREKYGFVQGFYKEYEDCDAFFITSNLISKDSSESIGCMSENNISKDKNIKKKSIHINSKSLALSIRNKNENCQIIKIIYDLEVFKNSYILRSDLIDYGVHFQELIDYIKNTQSFSHVNGSKNIAEILLLTIIKYLHVILEILNSTKKITKYSRTVVSLEENVVTFMEILKGIAKKQICPKFRNLLVAKWCDVILGLYSIQYLFTYEKEILFYMEYVAEVIIITLKELLTYLMGSPIGLKLNDSFNKALGSFFFYHIQMWQVFLAMMQPKLISKYLILLGVLGLSTQIAMFSDFISLATSHVYCIYIYAAKLYQLQVWSIRSLWRLSIGRKYNPLRDRVDSCQYSQHQLFVGTLLFTMSLFLLPTTTLYYVVFIALRLTLVAMHDILRRMGHLIRCLPIYVFITWIFNSSNLAGTLYLDVQDLDRENDIEIKVQLKLLPLTTSLRIFKPESIKSPKECNWGSRIQKVFTGILF